MGSPRGYILTLTVRQSYTQPGAPSRDLPFIPDGTELTVNLTGPDWWPDPDTAADPGGQWIENLSSTAVCSDGVFTWEIGASTELLLMSPWSITLPGENAPRTFVKDSLAEDLWDLLRPDYVPPVRTLRTGQEFWSGTSRPPSPRDGTLFLDRSLHPPVLEMWQASTSQWQPVGGSGTGARVVLSDAAPERTSTTAGRAGVSHDVSRADHVHQESEHVLDQLTSLSALTAAVQAIEDGVTTIDPLGSSTFQVALNGAQTNTGIALPADTPDGKLQVSATIDGRERRALIDLTSLHALPAAAPADRLVAVDPRNPSAGGNAWPFVWGTTSEENLLIGRDSSDDILLSSDSIGSWTWALAHKHVRIRLTDLDGVTDTGSVGDVLTKTGPNAYALQAPTGGGGGGGSSTLLGLSDVDDASYTGKAKQPLVVKDDETGAEFDTMDVTDLDGFPDYDNGKWLQSGTASAAWMELPAGTGSAAELDSWLADATASLAESAYATGTAQQLALAAGTISAGSGLSVANNRITVASGTATRWYSVAASLEIEGRTWGTTGTGTRTGGSRLFVEVYAAVNGTEVPGTRQTRFPWFGPWAPNPQHHDVKFDAALSGGDYITLHVVRTNDIDTGGEVYAWRINDSDVRVNELDVTGNEGPQGPPGRPGRDGTDGRDGRDGTGSVDQTPERRATVPALSPGREFIPSADIQAGGYFEFTPAALESNLLVDDYGYALGYRGSVLPGLPSWIVYVGGEYVGTVDEPAELTSITTDETPPTTLTFEARKDADQTLNFHGGGQLTGVKIYSYSVNQSLPRTGAWPGLRFHTAAQYYPADDDTKFSQNDLYRDIGGHYSPADYKAPPADPLLPMKALVEQTIAPMPGSVTIVFQNKDGNDQPYQILAPFSNAPFIREIEYHDSQSIVTALRERYAVFVWTHDAVPGQIPAKLRIRGTDYDLVDSHVSGAEARYVTDVIHNSANRVSAGALNVPNVDLQLDSGEWVSGASSQRVIRTATPADFRENAPERLVVPQLPEPYNADTHRVYDLIHSQVVRAYADLKPALSGFNRPGDGRIVTVEWKPGTGSLTPLIDGLALIRYIPVDRRFVVFRSPPGDTTVAWDRLEIDGTVLTLTEFPAASGFFRSDVTGVSFSAGGSYTVRARRPDGTWYPAEHQIEPGEYVTAGVNWETFGLDTGRQAVTDLVKPRARVSDTGTLITSAGGVTDVRVLTQAAYSALTTDPETLYVVT